jgi:hypothetical protein
VFRRLAGPLISEDRANQLLDAFAHQLAEQVLEFADQEEGHLTTAASAEYVQGIRDAAYLIDPKDL